MNTTITHTHPVESRQTDEDDHQAAVRFLSYWQLLGKVVSIFSIPLICFTIFLALKLNGNITWSYWIIFCPLLTLLLTSLLLTSSQKLSAPAPVQVRVIWLLWVVTLATFVVLLILKLEGKYFRPSNTMLFVPLWVITGIMFLCGFYVTFLGCCVESYANQRKYILSGMPVFCFGMVFLPLIFLIAFKEGVQSFSLNISWAVVFIPLFIADAFCFCMGFFLLLFSFGGRKDALFSISQLFIFVGIIPFSVVFKILLVMHLDHTTDIPLIFVFIPLVVIELLFMACGITVAVNTKVEYMPIKNEL